jgi:REP element-mobilizing transposase RayT
MQMEKLGLVLAYHIIIAAYGFWLPNDPRGSWSDFVWAWELARFGPATKTETRRSLADTPHDSALRQTAKTALLRPPVHFDGVQARAIGRGFADAKADGGYRIGACSILPEHVHLVVARHAERDIETIGGHLKARASTFLADENLHPFQYETGRRGKRPSPWSESFWQAYLDSPPDIVRAIRYVENNPVKEGLAPQRWSFVEECPSRPQGRG